MSSRCCLGCGGQGGRRQVQRIRLTATAISDTTTKQWAGGLDRWVVATTTTCAPNTLPLRPEQPALVIHCQTSYRAQPSTCRSHPQPQSAAAVAADEHVPQQPVGQHRHAPHGAAVSGQHSGAAAALPQPHGAVGRGAGQGGPAVSREADEAADRAGVADKGVYRARVGCARQRG